MFGTSVAISSDGSTIAAGAPSTVNSGAVYLFSKPTRTPTDQVVFQSSNGGGFASGNSRTLDSGASCQVTVLPPTADLTAPETVDLSATYGGDTTYAPSTAKT